MSKEMQCRLCLVNCNTFKVLYQTNGHCNVEIFEIVVKYFHPMFLSVIDGIPQSVICSKCWHFILEFYSYQQNIIRAQALLNRNAANNLKRKPTNVNRMAKPAAPNNEATVFPKENSISNENQSCTSLKPLASIHHRTDDSRDTRLLLPQNDVSPHATYLKKEPELIKIPEFVEPMLNIEMIKQEPIIDCIEEYEEPVEEYEEPVEEYEEPVGIFTGGEYDRVTENIQTTPTKSNVIELSSDDENDYDIQLMKTPENNRTFGNLSNMEYKAINPTKQEVIAATTIASKRKINSQNDNNDTICSNVATPNKMSRTDISMEDLILQWKHMPCCPICSEALPNYTFLRPHLLDNHPNARCNIQCCGSLFNNCLDLEQHIRFHLSPSNEVN